jgi:ferredoxin
MHRMHRTRKHDRQADFMNTTFRICSCNRSMPLDAAAGEKLGKALGTEALPVAHELCGRQVDACRDALKGTTPVVVGCTQESALFEELAQQENCAVPLRFVNLRETAGWGAQAASALPKMAALLADAALPAADPVPVVNYSSRGRVLVIGSADRALPWAERLSKQLSVNLLLTDARATTSMPHARRYPVLSGAQVEIGGWLGAFTVRWQQSNPIDLDRCVRCNACIDACPENAISPVFQIDQERCKRHGDCVEACGAVGAIDFTRQALRQELQCDLVFDLSPTPLIALHEPPQGYAAPANDIAAEHEAALRLGQLVGEFEKPKYFRYKEKLCAHSRNRKTGCTACIDVCSTGAISTSGSNRNHIKVDPHLCMGCGACTTVCPSGALGYGYPDAPYLGRRLKTLLTTYAAASGKQPVLLFHSKEGGTALINTLGRLAKGGKHLRGLPARVIPLALHHVASAGIDLWLSAIAWGASGIAVLATGEEAPQYMTALREQMQIAQAILSGLGYGGAHLQLIEAATPEALDAALLHAPRGEVPGVPARFNAFADKRDTLDFAIGHLQEHAPAKVEEIPLPAGAPFGSVQVDSAACTLCMACAGACPSSALMDTADRPQLRFIEKNCVQCGLCVQTCPENALALVPRLNLRDAAKNPLVLNETRPFSCIRCNKPFGTEKVIESMLARLAAHDAFSANLERLKMCGDCRVIDLMQSNPGAFTSARRP